jgi:hypothetical protein
MEISKQQFVSVQLTYEETLAALESYVRHKVWGENGLSLQDFKVEDYDPDCKGKGAFFLFLKESV